MPPDHAYFHHAETVRRLLYSPEYSNGIQYNANASISANALAMGDISKKYHPFRSNNSIIDNLHTWITEFGVLAGLEDYATDLVTGLNNHDAFQCLQDNPRHGSITRGGKTRDAAYDHAQHAAAYDDMLSPEAVILSMHASQAQGLSETAFLEQHLANNPPSRMTNSAIDQRRGAELDYVQDVCEAMHETAKESLRNLPSVPLDITAASSFRSKIATAMWKRASPFNYMTGSAGAVIGLGGQIQDWAPQPYVKAVTGLVGGLLTLTAGYVADKRPDPEGRVVLLQAAADVTCQLQDDIYKLLIAYIELYAGVTQVLKAHGSSGRPLTPEAKNTLRRLFQGYKTHFSPIERATSIAAGYSKAEQLHRSRHRTAEPNSPRSFSKLDNEGVKGEPSDCGHPSAAPDVYIPPMTVATSFFSTPEPTALVDVGWRVKEEENIAPGVREEEPPEVKMDKLADVMMEESLGVPMEDEETMLSEDYTPT
ncbi:hypothetical protein FB107DRAFT_272457 [Schizophyllum commune]